MLEYFYNWPYSVSLIERIDGVDKYVINPEYSKKVKERKIKELKELRDILEKRVIEVNKQLKDLEKSD